MVASCGCSDAAQPRSRGVDADTGPQDQPSGTWARVGFIAGGTAIAALGVAAIRWSDVTLLVVAISAGLSLIIGGLMRLALALRDTVSRRVVWTGLLSLTSVAVGTAILVSPRDHLELALQAIGGFWVVWGVLVVLIAVRPGGRTGVGATVAPAVLGIPIGASILAWPEPSLTVLQWGFGLGLVVLGVGVALNARQLGQSPASSPAQA